MPLTLHPVAQDTVPKRAAQDSVARRDSADTRARQRGTPRQLEAGVGRHAARARTTVILGTSRPPAPGTPGAVPVPVPAAARSRHRRPLRRPVPRPARCRRRAQHVQGSLPRQVGGGEPACDRAAAADRGRGDRRQHGARAAENKLRLRHVAPREGPVRDRDPQEVRPRGGVPDLRRARRAARAALPARRRGARARS